MNIAINEYSKKELVTAELLEKDRAFIERYINTITKRDDLCVQLADCVIKDIASRNEYKTANEIKKLTHLVIIQYCWDYIK